jgi:hypothetical protein
MTILLAHHSILSTTSGKTNLLNNPFYEVEVVARFYTPRRTLPTEVRPLSLWISHEDSYVLSSALTATYSGLRGCDEQVAVDQIWAPRVCGLRIAVRTGVTKLIVLV